MGGKGGAISILISESDWIIVKPNRADREIASNRFGDCREDTNGGRGNASQQPLSPSMRLSGAGRRGDLEAGYRVPALIRASSSETEPYT